MGQRRVAAREQDQDCPGSGISSIPTSIPTTRTAAAGCDDRPPDDKPSHRPFGPGLLWSQQLRRLFEVKERLHASFLSGFHAIRLSFLPSGKLPLFHSFRLDFWLTFMKDFLTSDMPDFRPSSRHSSTRTEPTEQTRFQYVNKSTYHPDGLAIYFAAH